MLGQYKEEQNLRSEFSEKQYEQLLNAELINKWSTIFLGTPEYPTPQEEAQLGYDAKYTVFENSRVKILYFQYKVATYHISTHGKSAKYSNEVGTPYFLAKVRGPKQGNQHNTLRILSKKNENVFYCAPKFHKFIDLNNYFTSKSIFSNSIFLAVKNLPDINDFNSHSIAYAEDGAKSAFFSKPIAVKPENISEAIERREPEIFSSQTIYESLIEAIEEGSGIKLAEEWQEKISIYGKINHLLNKYLETRMAIIRA